MKNTENSYPCLNCNSDNCDHCKYNEDSEQYELPKKEQDVSDEMRTKDLSKKP